MISGGVSRRAIAGAGLAWLAAGGGARAQAQPFDPGPPWSRASAGTLAPLDAPLHTPQGRRSLGDVAAGRPAVLNLWATWCPPCLAEKPHLNRLAVALREEGINAAVLTVLCFDGRVSDEEEVEKAYARHGGGDLLRLRATQEAERAFIAYFGAGSSSSRPAMPSSLLFDGSGRELGRLSGLAQVGAERRIYWSDPAARAMLRRLAGV